MTTSLPESKQRLLDQLVARLSRVPGMAAIVLGGSYASGQQHAASDLDLGLYYLEASPFAIADIQEVAATVAVEMPTVTGLYGWGAWVNGGAWVHTTQGKVDFIYRNLDQVRRTIAEARQGTVHHDYDQQPTYGFYSVIYLAETDICIPLYDPEGQIAALKAEVTPYPVRLKQAIVGDSLWAAEFTLLFARDYAAQGDVYNTVGCLTRIATNLTQALFALNERYFIRDKKVMAVVAGFPLLPPGYVSQIGQLLACPGATAEDLAQTVRSLEQVWRSVVDLTAGGYEPKFRL